MICSACNGLIPDDASFCPHCGASIPANNPYAIGLNNAEYQDAATIDQDAPEIPGFVRAIVICLMEKYACFSGRASRSEFWAFTLFNIIVFLGILLFCGKSRMIETIIPVFGFLFIIPWVAVAVRRLHDSDKSGWCSLIIIVPYVGAFTLFICMFLSSTSGPNRFGAAPQHRN